jgi:hypothetical protein
MAVNWYPGNMNKAAREIRKDVGKADLVLEVLDARLPDSGENPLVAKLQGAPPRIAVLNKQDLADPQVTASWLARLREQGGAIAYDQRPGGQTGCTRGSPLVLPVHWSRGREGRGHAVAGLDVVARARQGDAVEPVGGHRTHGGLHWAGPCPG